MGEKKKKKEKRKKKTVEQSTGARDVWVEEMEGKKKIEEKEEYGWGCGVGK